ncbi:hypothetical protein [Halosegnis sp.]|uniref:hypothetical protein n=1 Tax=Halosegnis sp. TaxID=2864959 RepID=UPI0035D454C6
MRLRTALDAYKRDDGPFPGTVPTHTGALAGHEGRLVHVSPTGAVRDYSAALSGRHGIDRSRFGLAGDVPRWFTDATPRDQRYVGDTRVVETHYDLGEITITQRDRTRGQTHLTRFTLQGPVAADARLCAFLTFAPTGRDRGVGRLVHRDGPTVVETYGREERDYLAAAPELAAVEGQVPERFAELLAADPVEFPRGDDGDRYEAAQLGGDVLVEVPLAHDGETASATLVTRLCGSTTDRSDAVTMVREAAATAAEGPLETGTVDRVDISVVSETPARDQVIADLRALDLLAAPTGARIAGPEFDPFTASSGGYGYTWFRDDAEVSRRLLAAADPLGLDVDDQLAAAARFYVDTQRSDGSWPHRVWAIDGSLAPGWANARLAGAADAYQADQTAAVVAYLATLVTERPAVLTTLDPVREAIAAGMDALTATVAADGLPERCQNLWENAHGRFTHTAATYLDAFARVAAAPVGASLQATAREHAARVLAGLDALWTGDAYGLALEDDRLDAGTFALADALASYDAAATLSASHLDRFEHHLRTALDGLARESAAGVAGLVRFDGDDWRRAGQSAPKVWSVATAWGAVAALRGAALLSTQGRDVEGLVAHGRALYGLLGPTGPFTSEVGLLAEQAFDDGRLDSATPLGWSHALRLDATALLAARDALE